MKSILTTILAIVTIAANAQMGVTLGKNSFQKKWLKNETYQMIWYAISDTAKLEIGKVSTQIKIDKKNITIVTHVNLKNMKTPWVDSTIAKISTLEPIHHGSYNMQRDMVLNFGKIVTGFYNDKTKQQLTIISDTTVGDYFDSNLYPSLIGWLPLKEGYKEDISIYDYNPSNKIGVIKARVNEVKSGTYNSISSGAKSVWIVTLTDEINTGKNDNTIYYIDKADRRLWKQEINAGGRKMMMQLTEK